MRQCIIKLMIKETHEQELWIELSVQNFITKEWQKIQIYAFYS